MTSHTPLRTCALQSSSKPWLAMWTVAADRSLLSYPGPKYIAAMHWLLQVIFTAKFFAPSFAQSAIAALDASASLRKPVAAPPVVPETAKPPHVSIHLPVGHGAAGSAAACGIGAQPSMP